MSTFDIAASYRSAGVSVIPLRLDGSKAPALESWAPYRERIATESELAAWFRSTEHGIGMVCGAISGGLEVIDFDAGELLEPWLGLVSSIARGLPIIETPSGGWHVLLRCDEIGGNNKIAMDPQRAKQTLIETRGEGGYVVAEGSPCATHATGLPYIQSSGPQLPDIPRISPNGRRELWTAARTFDRRGEEFRSRLVKKQVRRALGPAANRDTHPVVAEFNDRTSWQSILVGWTTRDGEHWTRPGKQFGVSARIVIADDGEELLTVFSGNAGPLSPDGSFRTWNKFSAWAEIEFRGDRKVAFNAARSGVTA